jgi:hypothetical protein
MVTSVSDVDVDVDAWISGCGTCVAKKIKKSKNQKIKKSKNRKIEKNEILSYFFLAQLYFSINATGCSRPH